VRRIFVLLVVTATALVVASGAAADALTCGHGSSCGGAAPGAPPGTLPFTGLDLAGGAVIAALLLASGTVLRRAGRRRQ